MTERVSRLISYLEEQHFYVWGVSSGINPMFSCTEGVYCADGITVFYSPLYNCLEIFGCTDDEFTEAAKRLDHSSEMVQFWLERL